MYTWKGMKKISYREAVENKKNKQLYLLYGDDTESAVESMDDIERHAKYDGEFGYEKMTCRDYLRRYGYKLELLLKKVGMKRLSLMIGRAICRSYTRQ
jgi:DNA polymerase III delta subunit